MAWRGGDREIDDELDVGVDEEVCDAERFTTVYLGLDFGGGLVEVGAGDDAEHIEGLGTVEVSL